MFYEQFEKACKARNTKATKVLEEIGVSKSNATHYKNGSIPNGTVIIQLSEILNVSCDYLLTGKQEDPQITEEEQEILKIYRSLTEKEKGKAEILLEQLAEESAEKKEKKSS